MLNNFQKTTLTISTIFLIIALIITGYLMLKSLMEQSYPPVISDCPDYWDVKYNNSDTLVCNNLTTVNKGKAIDKCSTVPVTNFYANGTNINDTICEKYKWARDCDIVWDGITNNSEPCKKTSI